METSPHMRDQQVRSLRVRNVVKQTPETKPKMTREQAQQAIKDVITKRAQGDTDTTAAAEVVAADATAALTSGSGNAPLSDISKEELLIQSLLDTRDSPDVLMSGEITLPIGVHTPPSNAAEAAAIAAAEAEAAAAATAAGLPSSIPITWHSKVSQIPADGGPLIVLAHEFFDALPVYQFVMTERGWCEKMVDEDRGAGPHHFRFVLSAQPTLASRTFLPPEKFPPQDAKIGEAVEMSVDLLGMPSTLRRGALRGGTRHSPDSGYSFCTCVSIVQSCFCLLCFQLRCWSCLHGGPVPSSERVRRRCARHRLRHEPSQREHAAGRAEARIQARARGARQGRPHRAR
jgi:hypothetical protein